MRARDQVPARARDRAGEDGRSRRLVAGLAARLRQAGLALALCGAVWPAAAQSGAPTDCRAGPIYLTFDTGNMRYARWIGDLLERQRIKATFFLANEKTPDGDHALEPNWRSFWSSMAAAGHAFGSHTFDHVYFKDAAARSDGFLPAVARPQFGARAGQGLSWTAGDLCTELKRVDSRFREMTGRGLDPIWRAPGGKAPQSVMQAAQQCGFRHAYWADAGFLGDELPSERFSNRALLDRALARLKGGDIVMAHLGIWSRKDPFAPMLEPLIDGLKARGHCFATLLEHPDYRSTGKR